MAGVAAAAGSAGHALARDRAKLALLALAFGNIALQHGLGGFRAALTEGSVARRTRVLAAVSLVLWPSVLLAGRWIAFV